MNFSTLINSPTFRAVVTGQVRHLVTLGAGALLTYGLVHSQTQVTEAVDVGTSVALGVVALAWSALSKVLARQAWFKALNSTPPS